MEICSGTGYDKEQHEEICYEGKTCPLCESLKVNIDRDYWFAYFTYKIKEIYGN
jgi:hypothetical protein